MLPTALRAATATAIGTHLNYLDRDGRHLLAGVINTSSIGDIRAAAIGDPRDRHAWLTTTVRMGQLDNASHARIWAVTRTIMERCQGDVREGYAVIHGPPQEPVKVHAHLVLRRATFSPQVNAYERHRLREAVMSTAADFGIPRENFQGSKSYAGIGRGDAFSFYEWCCEAGVDTLLESGLPAAELPRVLNEYGLRYDLVANGAIISDATSHEERRFTLPASALNLSPNAIEAHLGTLPRYDYDRDLATRSYSAERYEKYSRELRNEHKAARSNWNMAYSKPYSDARRVALATGTNLVHRADEFVAHLAERRGANLAPRETELATAWATRQMQAYRSRLAREAADTFPPRPAPRLADWLKQLYIGTPDPVASATTVTLDQSAVAAWDHDNGVDLDLYDQGLRVARIDGDCLHLLTDSFPSRSLNELPLLASERATVHHAASPAEVGAIGTALRAARTEHGTRPTAPASVDAALGDEPTAWVRTAWQRHLERPAMADEVEQLTDEARPLQQQRLRRRRRSRTPR